jgi:NitT/TauT family transport system permease protein
MPATPSTETVHDAELAGIDALDVPIRATGTRISRLWAGSWPKLAATGLALGVWQLLATLHVKPAFILPGPAPVFKRLFSDLASGTLPKATLVTLRRAAIGYGLAVVIGSALGLAVARSKILRSAIGAMITGLQTMPTIAWFPLAIMLFSTSETAITFVVVLGAAPAIANGLIGGIDNIQPILLRAGRVLGARGSKLYRHVVLPAAFPGFVSGLKQGWAFAWRSLMAGELLVVIGKSGSLGANLAFAGEQFDAPGLYATMIVILVIGLVMDALVFGRLEHVIRERWGLIESS